MAHGYEIVHTHFPGWKFSAAQAVADGGLHGRLLVGHAVKLPAGAAPEALIASLAGLKLRLYGDGVLKDQGVGANVLDGPVQALLHLCGSCAPRRARRLCGPATSSPPAR